MYDLSGRRLGKYEIDQPIGRGGMATVYLGHDLGLNRPVAIKVMDPALTAEPGAVERFRREAITAANLEHPHIMPVYDVREDDGLWYLAMRYVPGETLREILQGAGPLPPDQIVRLLRPVADALDYAHNHGVTHRDIKPGNILVEPDGNVVLTDFGIARSGADVRLTRAGQVMGTADYLAPEQIRGEEATASSDLYSLGILLYEMLAGQCPFSGDNPAEILYKQVHTPPPPLRALRSDLPPALQGVIDQALNKNPALRYTTARDLVQAVAAATAAGITRVAAPKPGYSGAALAPAPVGAPPLVLAPRRPAQRDPAPPGGAATDRFGAWTPDGPLPSVVAPGRRGRRLPLALVAVVLLGLAIVAVGLLRTRPAGNGGLPSPQPQPVADAFAAPATVPYTGPLRKDNGADLHANRATRAPVIDGKLDDWSGAMPWPAAYVVAELARPKSPADLSADFRIGYDDTNFYLGAVITDDVHVQNKLTRDFALWKGDDVELWFDTDLIGDFPLDPGNGDDYQMGFSPGDFGALSAQAVFFRPTPADALKAGAHVAVLPRPDGHGYTLEAAVPWVALHMRAPQPGGAIGFCASAGDNDVPNTAQQQKMISTCSRMQWNVPTTFGNLFW